MNATPQQPDETEAKIDSTIDKIDQALSKIHARAKKGGAAADTPTSAFKPENLRKTQMAFQAMCQEEDPLASSKDSDEAPAPEKLARATARRRA